MFTLVLIGLVGGIVTGISPCILPVLPVVLLAGGSGGRSGRDRPADAPDPGPGGGVAVESPPATRARRSLRPYLVIAGMVVSFSFFTLLGALVLSALGLPDDLLKTVGVVLLVLIGLGLIFPKVEAILEKPFSRLPQRAATQDRGAFVLGLGLGLLYVPCAGPVLTAIIVAGATGDISGRIVVLTIAFAIGATLPLLVFALAGQQMSRRIAAFRRNQTVIRRVSGVVMILLAIALAFDAAQAVQRAIPDYTAGLQKEIAKNPALKPQLTNLGDGSTEQLSRCEDGQTELRDCGPAPEFRNIAGWLNTPGDAPLTMSGLRGKVVLIDFWTYSCINCQRSVPHVEAWDRAYRDAGLQVVGIHTPEFAFERDRANVIAGAKALNVRYPVAMDNMTSMFTAYRNQYWPAQFLVDAKGQVRYFKLGEGNYDTTERLIRRLLTDANPGVRLPAGTEVADRTVTDQRTTHETYLNAGQIQNYVGDPLALEQPHDYRFPAGFPPNTVGLDGTWNVGYEYAEAGPGARIGFHVNARQVYAVVEGQGSLDVAVDGKPESTIPVSGTPRVYPLMARDDLVDAQLTLGVSPGLRVYVFTFG